MNPRTASNVIEQFFVNSFPTVVGTSVALEPGGSNQQADHDRLVNPYDNAMLIDEIRFRTLSPELTPFLMDSSDPGRSTYNYGGTVRVMFSLGRTRFSRVPIPLGCFAPPIVNDGPLVSDFGVSTDTAEAKTIVVVPGAHPGRISMGYFRWVLPRSVLVPAGMVLDAVFTRTDDGIVDTTTVPTPPSAVRVDVAYAGRVARGPVPGNLTIPVPYVGLFAHDFTVPTIAVSGENDLSNPFDQPLHVQRLIGRLQTIYASTKGAALNGRSIALDQSCLDDAALTYFPGVTLRTFEDFNITRVQLPGVNIFEGYKRSLSLNTTLQKNQGFQVSVDGSSGLPATGGLDGFIEPGLNTAFVTMVGWREEKL